MCNGATWRLISFEQNWDVFYELVLPGILHEAGEMIKSKNCNLSFVQSKYYSQSQNQLIKQKEDVII